MKNISTSKDQGEMERSFVQFYYTFFAPQEEKLAPFASNMAHCQWIDEIIDTIHRNYSSITASLCPGWNLKSKRRGKKVKKRPKLKQPPFKVAFLVTKEDWYSISENFIKLVQSKWQPGGQWRRSIGSQQNPSPSSTVIQGIRP